LELHDWLGIVGIVVTVVLAFGAFYEKVQRDRMAEVRRENRAQWSKIGALEVGLSDHRADEAGTKQTLVFVLEQIKELNRKLDRLIGMNGGGHA
jgi:hypothetical protein